MMRMLGGFSRRNGRRGLANCTVSSIGSILCLTLGFAGNMVIHPVVGRTAEISNTAKSTLLPRSLCEWRKYIK